MYYHDWLFRKDEEIFFDCSSGGVPHKHCMGIMIAEKISVSSLGRIFHAGAADCSDPCKIL